MAWVRVDDKMAQGPKVKRAAAKLGGKFPRRRVLAVWMQAMSYCNLNLTDGFVPDFEVADIEDERPADVFTAMSVGDESLGAIVERDDKRGGWVFRNYLEYQPSKASVEEKAEIDRKRKAEWRASKARPKRVQKCPTGTDTDGDEVSPLTDPNRPEPTRTDPSPVREHAPARSGSMGGTHTIIDGRWQRTHGEHKYGPACDVGACVLPKIHSDFTAALSVSGGKGPDGRDLRIFYSDEVAAIKARGKPVGDTFAYWQAAFGRWVGVEPRHVQPSTKGSRTIAAGNRLQAQLDAGAELDPFGLKAIERERVAKELPEKASA